MRALALALLAAGGLALAGCSDPERDEVGASVETFVHAYAAGDTRTACARLVPEVRKAFKEGCEAGLKKETDALSAAERQRLARGPARGAGRPAPRRRRVADREPLVS